MQYQETENIEFESDKTLVELLNEYESYYDSFEDQTQWMPTIKPGAPYSYPELKREITRRENVRDDLRDHWIESRKLKPCPICNRTFSKRGRGLAWNSAKRHVLACKGE